MSLKKVFFIGIGILIVIVCFFIAISKLQDDYYDTKYWISDQSNIKWSNDRSLTFNDFIIDDNFNSTYGVNLYCATAMRYGLGENYFIKSKVIMMPEESFIKDPTDSIALQVAQLRFNIFELSRREMNVYFKDSIIQNRNYLFESDIDDLMNIKDSITDDYWNLLLERNDTEFENNLTALNIFISKKLKDLPNEEYIGKD